MRIRWRRPEVWLLLCCEGESIAECLSPGFRRPQALFDLQMAVFARVFTWSSLCVSVCVQISPSYKGTGHPGLGSTLVMSS